MQAQCYDHAFMLSRVEANFFLFMALKLSFDPWLVALYLWHQHTVLEESKRRKNRKRKQNEVYIRSNSSSTESAPCLLGKHNRKTKRATKVATVSEPCLLGKRNVHIEVEEWVITGSALCLLGKQNGVSLARFP